MVRNRLRLYLSMSTRSLQSCEARLSSQPRQVTSMSLPSTCRRYVPCSTTEREREVAANSKEQGNECVKMKQWKQAKDLYTQGLAALKAQRKDQAEGGVSGEIEVEREQRVVDLDEEEREEGKLKEALLVNRALANLELRMYRFYLVASIMYPVGWVSIDAL